jgi:hypothetical protein
LHSAQIIAPLQLSNYQIIKSLNQDSVIIETETLYGRGAPRRNKKPETQKRRQPQKQRSEKQLYPPVQAQFIASQKRL